MLALLGTLPSHEYTPFFYMISSGDKHSLLKAQAFEEHNRGVSYSQSHEMQTLIIPRARSVGQSWISTPFSVLWSFGFCLWNLGITPIVMYWTRASQLPFADIVLMNGPATCVPVVAVFCLLRVCKRLNQSFWHFHLRDWCTLSRSHAYGLCR